MFFADGAYQLFRIRFMFLFAGVLCCLGTAASPLFFLNFSLNFISIHPLVPASLLNGLHGKEQADRNNRNKINDSCHVKHAFCKIIIMSAQVKYVQYLLDTTLENTGFYNVYDHKGNLSHSSDHYRDQDIFDHGINDDRDRHDQKSECHCG